LENKETKILVVEDEASMALLLTRLLEKLGYSVLPIEKTGQGGIDAALNLNPDIILMDIYLEGEMNGIQAAEKILAAKNIPVIYATADSDEETIKTARSTYPLGYILKPYNKKVLKSTIEVALSIREVEARKNAELRSAYDTISNQTIEIMESFKSAKEIQKAILPTESSFGQHIDNSFILNLPKESLGGDFFWYKTLTNNRMLFGVIDCTGHGVPGALMSILVNYQLSKALSQLSADNHLGELFEAVDEVLNDSFGDESTNTDADEIQNLNSGFDGALLLLSEDQRKVSFCGAKRPLLIVRNGELIEIKGSRSSVGLYAIPNKEFAVNQVELEQGDMVYAFSDGYADQIGGEKGRRLKAAPFKSKLIEVSDLPITVQKQELLSFFKSWKGIYEQMDDVLIVGFRVK
jgi:serine phosphatase RsbU (regulator of sigma subunit)